MKIQNHMILEGYDLVSFNLCQHSIVPIVYLIIPHQHISDMTVFRKRQNLS